MHRICAGLLLAAGCALLARDAARAEDAEALDTRHGATAGAERVVSAARKAAQGDKATKDALDEARGWLDPWLKDARTAHWKGGKEKTPSFSKAWNELVTVSRYHGFDGKADFVLDRHEILWKRYLLGLPTGDSWSWTYNTDTKTSDQLLLLVHQMRPNGKPLRKIKVWVYRWDTIYSGVGGENYKKLAKMMHELDRDSMAKQDRKASRTVTAKRLSSEFPRVYYYFVEGFDVDEEKRIRRDNYYMKGDNMSFNFEVITYLDPTDGDDAVTTWQCGENDPEIAAVLESLTLNPDKEK